MKVQNKKLINQKPITKIDSHLCLVRPHEILQMSVESNSTVSALVTAAALHFWLWLAERPHAENEAVCALLDGRELGHAAPAACGLHREDPREVRSGADAASFRVGIGIWSPCFWSPGL